MIHRRIGRAAHFFSSLSATPKFQHLTLSYPTQFVAHVELNRPEKRNALNAQLWKEIGECFKHLAHSDDCRSVVLSGAGKTFSAGIDLSDMADLMQTIVGDQLDSARKAFKLRELIKSYQSSFTAIEKCSKPVIASISGLCLGGAMGIITATDVRYAALDANFQIKEVELGLAPDVGHLQRLPKIVGNDGLVRELCFSARMFGAEEALRMGLVSRLFDSKADALDACVQLAACIAKKSPVAVQGTKQLVNFSRDHSVDESLEAMANWNMAMLQSEDLLKAATAVVSKQSEAVEFAKL